MKLEGEISEINLIERIVELGRERFTGAVRFENDGIIKILYFKGGDILSASTNDRADSVDEILLKAGKVTREHVKQALAKRKENETLGDALLGLGFITRKELTWARRVQAIGVIRSISAWTNGSFTVVADYLPKREEGTLFPLQQILVELIVTEQDRAKFDQALEGGEAVFEKAPTFFDDYARLGLNEDADAIVAQVDGRRTASEVSQASGKDAFNVYKLLHALATLGLISRAAKPQVTHEGFAGIGVGDAADVWGDFSPTPEPEPVASVASFELADEQAPTLEIPRVEIPDEPEPEPLEPPMPVAVAAPPPPPPVMPAFDAPPKPTKEEQWGFDEAQIETAQRAAAGPPPIPPKAPVNFKPVAIKQKQKKSNLGGVIVVGLVLGLLAAGGFFGWKWWEGRNATADPVLVARAPRTTTQPPATPVVAPAVPEATTTAPPAGGLVVSTQAPTTTTTTVAPAAPGQAGAPVPPSVPAPGTRVERARGGVVITNTTGAAPASNDATRARYDAMARDFAARASGNYTVQFELVCETASITKAINEGGNKIWFIPTTYRGRPCYRVFWGTYDTAEAATRGASEIPASLRGVQPVVIRTPK